MNAKPTAEQQATKNLQEIWSTKRKELKLTQADLAEQFGNITQSAINHYLTGRCPLNVDAVINFARCLHVKPWEIYPELFTGVDLGINLTTEEKSLLSLYKRSNKNMQHLIQELLIEHVDRRLTS